MPYITKVKGHDGTTIYDVKDTEARRSRVFVGTCPTAAATAAKAISVDSDFTLEKGREIAIKFTYTNTANNPTFSINSGTAKSVFYNTGVITTSNKDKAGTSNLYNYYIYDGTNWVWEGWSKDLDTNTTYTNQKLGNAYGIQSNSSASATVTSAISGYTLTAYGRVTIKFFYDVPADATLNINSTGAKNIQVHNGNSLQNVEANYIKAGDLVTLVYDGTRYIITNINRGNDIVVTMTLTSGTPSGGIAPITVTNASHTPAQVSTYLSQNKNVVAIGTVDTYSTIFFTPFLKASGEGDAYDILLSGCGWYMAPVFYALHGNTSGDTWAGYQTMGANSEHNHGNIDSTGSITDTSHTITDGDRLILGDSSDSIVGSDLTFGTSTTTYLRNDGTWGTPAGTGSNYYHTPVYSSGMKIGTGVGIADLYVPTGSTASTVSLGNHAHGNLTTDGKLTTTATIASGDKLVIVDTDSTAGNKITGSSITFGTSTTTYLRNDGTWGTPTDTNTVPSAYCDTAAGTAAKTAVCTDWTLTAKSYIQVVIKNANTYNGALTLSINGTAAKPVYINNAVSSSSNKTLPAGSYFVYYDGTNYYFQTDGYLRTGGVVLGVPDNAQTPMLIFQRATLTDNYNDWGFYDSGGLLYLAQRGSGSSGWTDTRATFTQSGCTLSGTTSGTFSGNITGNINGKSSLSAAAVASGDALLIADSSNSNKITPSTTTFGTATTTYLRNDGTWGTPAGLEYTYTASTLSAATATITLSNPNEYRAYILSGSSDTLTISLIINSHNYFHYLYLQNQRSVDVTVTFAKGTGMAWGKVAKPVDPIIVPSNYALEISVMSTGATSAGRLFISKSDIMTQFENM